MPTHVTPRIFRPGLFPSAGPEHTYKVCADRDGTSYSALLSSVYSREGGEWKLKLHQYAPFEEEEL